MGSVPADAVAGFELFKVAPRWLFLKLETRNGVVGWGEPTLEGFVDTVAACVEEMMASVVGQDPSRIQHIWQKLHLQKFYTGGPVIMSALAGIDQALWDIKGKTLNVPVHVLLGGRVRDKVTMYRWCGGDSNTPEDAAKEALHVVQTTGFRQLKMNATPKMGYVEGEPLVSAVVQRMKAVRDAVGPAVGIGLDFHGRVKAPMAKRLMKALEPFDPLFFEEPVAKAQNKSLHDLSLCTSVPLATGERMYTVAEFRDLLEYRSVAIVQPDCSHVGGITALLTIARMAEAYEVALAPHCPLGPIALAACLAVDVCCVNFAFQESSVGIHYNAEGGEPRDTMFYVKNKDDFAVVDGCMNVLQKPGLGVEIDEDAVREAAGRWVAWRDREWTLADGTPTTW
ncbi:D-galactonate dehydratase [Diplonema papillatum]|nr:D-galactonate dehydratase [Diplonema papillatum]|eukprot:gene12454-19268_t